MPESLRAVDYKELEPDLEEEFNGSNSEEAPDNVPPLSPTLSSLPLTARVSSLLFVFSRPLSLGAIARASGGTKKAVARALNDVKEMFQDEVHGFSLHEINGGYQLRSAPAAAELVKRMVPPKSRRLSRAAVETLAVVAYRQPIQRAEIDAIRGVDALPTIKTLMESRLIRIVGQEDSPGRPTLYGTTPLFLEKFGLKDLSELPSVQEIERLFNEPGEVEIEGDEDEEMDDLDTATPQLDS